MGDTLDQLASLQAKNSDLQDHLGRVYAENATLSREVTKSQKADTDKGKEINALKATIAKFAAESKGKTTKVGAATPDKGVNPFSEYNERLCKRVEALEVENGELQGRLEDAHEDIREQASDSADAVHNLAIEKANVRILLDHCQALSKRHDWYAQKCADLKKAGDIYFSHISMIATTPLDHLENMTNHAREHFDSHSAAPNSFSSTFAATIEPPVAMPDTADIQRIEKHIHGSGSTWEDDDEYDQGVHAGDEFGISEGSGTKRLLTDDTAEEQLSTDDLAEEQEVQSAEMESEVKVKDEEIDSDPTERESGPEPIPKSVPEPTPASQFSTINKQGTGSSAQAIPSVKLEVSPVGTDDARSASTTNPTKRKALVNMSQANKDKLPEPTVQPQLPAPEAAPSTKGDKKVNVKLPLRTATQQPEYETSFPGLPSGGKLREPLKSNNPFDNLLKTDGRTSKGMTADLGGKAATGTSATDESKPTDPPTGAHRGDHRMIPQDDDGPTDPKVRAQLRDRLRAQALRNSQLGSGLMDTTRKAKEPRAKQDVEVPDVRISKVMPSPKSEVVQKTPAEEPPAGHVLTPKSEQTKESIEEGVSGGRHLTKTVKRCRICQGNDHIARDCPSSKGSSQDQPLSQADSSKGKEAQQTSKPQPPASANKDPQAKGSVGETVTKASTSGKTPGSCHNCGEDTHLQRDCPRLSKMATSKPLTRIADSKDTKGGSSYQPRGSGNRDRRGGRRGGRSGSNRGGNQGTS